MVLRLGVSDGSSTHYNGYLQWHSKSAWLGAAAEGNQEIKTRDMFVNRLYSRGSRFDIERNIM